MASYPSGGISICVGRRAADGPTAFIEERRKAVTSICRFQIFSKEACALRYMTVQSSFRKLRWETYLRAGRLFVDAESKHDCARGFKRVTQKGLDDCAVDNC